MAAKLTGGLRRQVIENCLGPGGIQYGNVLSGVGQRLIPGYIPYLINRGGG